MSNVFDFCSVCDSEVVSYVRYGVVHCAIGHVIGRDDEGYVTRQARARVSRPVRSAIVR